MSGNSFFSRKNTVIRGYRRCVGLLDKKKYRDCFSFLVSLIQENPRCFFFRFIIEVQSFGTVNRLLRWTIRPVRNLPYQRHLAIERVLLAKPV